MNRNDYRNTIGMQIEDLQDLVDLQTEKCFDLRKLASMLDKEACEAMQRIVMTGCGDSFSAAGAMKPALIKFSGINEVSVPDPMEYCRFYDNGDTKLSFQDHQVLVIAVSASGGSERIVEMMEKGKSQGVSTMLITNNPESIGAKAAQLVFHVETPPGCNTPGLRSYFASMIAITALGAYIGLIKGHITLERFQEIKASIVAQTKAMMAGYENMDEQMFKLAQAWKEYERFEVIGDWDELSSAQFVEEKFIECAGVHCTHADSEDWCHINFWLRNPESIGTLVLVNSKAPNFDRMQYTIRSAIDIGRPVLVVTDAEPEDFPEKAVVCRLPAANETWLMPLVDFAPGSMLGAYIAALSGKMFFGGRYDYRTQTWNR